MKTINSQPACSFPVAVIVSRFNEDVTEKLKLSALSKLESKGFSANDIQLYEVPGAVEIPIIAKLLAKKGQVKAIITLGAVIRGETTHYDYVCAQVSEGCQQVMMDYEIPVIFGVLTTENTSQALDRVGGNHGNKAHDAVEAAIEMVNLLEHVSKD